MPVPFLWTRAMCQSHAEDSLKASRKSRRKASNNSGKLACKCTVRGPQWGADLPPGSSSRDRCPKLDLYQCHRRCTSGSAFAAISADFSDAPSQFKTVESLDSASRMWENRVAGVLPVRRVQVMRRASNSDTMHSLVKRTRLRSLGLATFELLA